MILKVIASSSKGNAYALKDKQGNLLLLECGIDYQKILQAVSFKRNRICGCLLSHRHSDHAKALPELIRHGIPTFATQDVFDAFHIKARNAIAIRNDSLLNGHGKILKIGPYRAIAFNLIHDVPCTGYLIMHEEMGTLFFATDTVACQYPFQHVNHILIEANYLTEILDQRIEAGEVPASLKPRLMNSHMELRQTIQFLKAMGLKDCKEIVLLHLSKLNADEEYFRKKVQSKTDINTHIAQPNITINLTL